LKKSDNWIILKWSSEIYVLYWQNTVVYLTVIRNYGYDKNYLQEKNIYQTVTD